MIPSSKQQTASRTANDSNMSYPVWNDPKLRDGNSSSLRVVHSVHHVTSTTSLSKYPCTCSRNRNQIEDEPLKSSRCLVDPTWSWSGCIRRPVHGEQRQKHATKMRNEEITSNNLTSAKTWDDSRSRISKGWLVQIILAFLSVRSVSRVFSACHMAI